MDDTLDLDSEGDRYVVCGKNVEHGRGLAHFKHGEVMLAVHGDIQTGSRTLRGEGPHILLMYSQKCSGGARVFTHR